MIDDLMRQYELVGMRRDEVLELLGAPDPYPGRISGDALYYWLGPERGLIGIDSEYLWIELNENGMVSRAEVRSD